MIPLNASRWTCPYRYRFAMAWEWVAPVATGLVGMAGIAGTYLNGRLQTNTSVRLAREERTQNRLERAYLEVQRVVERYAQWADAIMPFMSGAGHDPHPPLPENDGQMLEATALCLYWSPEVRQLVQAWTDARNRLAVQSSTARVHETLNADAWMKAPELKQAIRDTGEALLARMSEELRAVEPVQRRRWRPLAARTRP
jgi:hypothetical protein